MNCNFNCSECELVAKKKRILVDVIGLEPEGGMLSFAGRQHLTVEFGEYIICFVNFCGEDVHIGRKILFSTGFSDMPYAFTSVTFGNRTDSSRSMQVMARTRSFWGFADERLAVDSVP